SEPSGSGPCLARFTANLPSPIPWAPDTPALYTAALRLADGDERVIRLGLRSIQADGDRLLLNGRPLYPRLILSWGWYPGALSPNPGPERVRQDFARLRSMGYNGVKLCLWFPPQYYFDLADELGMLLWVELPMWLPNPDDHFRRQTPLEYARLARAARQHPSVILYSLGCELNRSVGPDILGPLYALLRREGGGALVRDNSGSGEAYGGLLNEFADYYDYHFYAELHFLRGLLDSFTPRWRTPQPWVFGEFCDYDTFRDIAAALTAEDQAPAVEIDAIGAESSANSALSTEHSALSWWLSLDPAVNPQGARWQMDAPHLAERLRAAGLRERLPELVRLSELHALLHRKVTLELVRTYREITGYVVTGEADTPITTAGMWDDAGRLKLDPAAFAAFNSDLLLALGWDKRRAWVAGGDRAAPWDTFSYTSGALVRPHIIASHYGASTGPARVSWSAAYDGEPPFAVGEAVTLFPLAPGDVRELLVAEFIAPEVRAPRALVIRAAAELGAERTSNEWRLWVFPRGAWDGTQGVVLHDPAGLLAGLTRLAPHITRLVDFSAEKGEGGSLHPSLGAGRGAWGEGAPVLIATAWSPTLDAWVREGGRAVFLQSPESPPCPVPALPMPFWREALRLCEPHPAWRDFPHDGWAALQLHACAPDHALDTAPLAERARPILRRVDTRTAQVHDYAAELEWGAGRLIITTLRLQGGHGDQPAGIERSPAAAYLLACWVRHLLML
ncbi:MAG: hypothetical protein RLZZ387_1527, partial [Chloroflexota bacterium]